MLVTMWRLYYHEQGIKSISISMLVTMWRLYYHEQGIKSISVLIQKCQISKMMAIFFNIATTDFYLLFVSVARHLRILSDKIHIFIDAECGCVSRNIRMPMKTATVKFYMPLNHLGKKTQQGHYIICKTNLQCPYV